MRRELCSMAGTVVRVSLCSLLLAGCGAPETTPETPSSTTAESTSSAVDGQSTAFALEVIADGADIAGANGVHFGPDGNLYVASVVGSDITVIDPDTGNIIRRLTAADGVIGPDDVAFASDGSFFWTSILTGEVAGFSADGERVVAAQLAPGVNPVTFSDDDRLFVAQCFLGDDLFEVDPAGVEEPRVIAADLGPGCGLNGMDWGPDKRLYGPRWFTGQVVSFDVDSGDMRVEAEGFSVPAAVKFNSAGELHVLDTAEGTVIRVNEDGLETVATLEPGLDNFAFDSKDRLFVSSFADGFVKRVEPDGSLTTLAPGGLSHAGGIAIRGNEAIVADLHAIRRYDVMTGDSTGVERNVVGVGEMGGAMNIAVDGENLILTSWFDGDVRIWNPDTRERIAQYTDVIAPVSAVRFNGEIVVADHGASAVVAFGDGGKRVIADSLPSPTGLVVEQSNLYLSDRERGEILLLATGDNVLESPLVVADNLNAPEGFIVTTNGFIVVEGGGAIVQVDDTGSRTVLATMAPGSPAAGGPPAQVFNGIARAENGDLLIPGETERVLYRLRLPGT